MLRYETPIEGVGNKSPTIAPTTIDRRLLKKSNWKTDCKWYKKRGQWKWTQEPRNLKTSTDRKNIKRWALTQFQKSISIESGNSTHWTNQTTQTWWTSWWRLASWLRRPTSTRNTPTVSPSSPPPPTRLRFATTHGWPPEHLFGGVATSRCLRPRFQRLLCKRRGGGGQGEKECRHRDKGNRNPWVRNIFVHKVFWVQKHRLVQTIRMFWPLL